MFQLGKLRIGMLFCIEMNDKEQIIADYQDANLDVIFWISFIKWDDTSIPENIIHNENSLDISLELKVPIVNVNWANALNNTSLRGLGASRIIQNGKIYFELKEDKEELKIIELKEKAIKLSK